MKFLVRVYHVRGPIVAAGEVRGGVAKVRPETQTDLVWQGESRKAIELTAIELAHDQSSHLDAIAACSHYFVCRID